MDKMAEWALPTPQPTLEEVELELASVGNVVLATVKAVETRPEPRYNQRGELRGVAFRERNKGRKAVHYVGAKSKGERETEYRFYANAYRRSANGGSVGNLLHPGEATGRARAVASVGNDKPAQDYLH